MSWLRLIFKTVGTHGNFVAFPAVMTHLLRLVGLPQSLQLINQRLGSGDDTSEGYFHNIEGGVIFFYGESEAGSRYC